MSRMEFLPMPMDSMFDTRLTLTDLRVLGAIAYFDRRSANGRGCFATASTLAQMAHCDTRTVKRATAKLRELNFIRSETSKSDGRRLIHRVVYMSGPAEIGGTAAPDQAENRGQPHPISGTLPHSVSYADHEVMDTKQSQKQIPIIGETDAGEPASLLQTDAHAEGQKPRERSFEERVGTYLRGVEAAMGDMDCAERSEHAERLFDLVDKHLQHGDALYFWAERLMSEVEWLNDQASYDEANKGAAA